ncbi:uncharacterized protein LOC116417724 [Nasonia vitripennis]|uniref:Uncharacterized protein n=1 Tax=Nasonia vitripennis TaxID=7425 RepID=A0A7M7QJA7_NASVI|nr:uncharacterized protein LOC116417724 [Nasonia vitripennis]
MVIYWYWHGRISYSWFLKRINIGLHQTKRVNRLHQKKMNLLTQTLRIQDRNLLYQLSRVSWTFHQDRKPLFVSVKDHQSLRQCLFIKQSAIDNFVKSLFCFVSWTILNPAEVPLHPAISAF